MPPLASIRMDFSNARTLDGLLEGIRFHAIYQSRRLRRARTVRVDGVRVPLDLPIMTPKIRTNVIKGFYEKHERLILGETISPDDVVLDVGGGIGYIAAFCAKRCDTVETVEANPALVPVIERVLSMNDVQARVHHGVLSDGAGIADFEVDEDFWASSTRAAQEPHRERVHVTRIDAPELERRLRPTYLVMDIEGGEIDLLPMLDLSTVNKVCVETHANIVGQKSVDEAVQQVVDRGFTLDSRLSRPNQLFLARRG